MFFVSTSDPRISGARVAGRVMNGGHTVPIEKIVSRYERSMANLSAAIALADRVYVYDNSVDGVEATLCARSCSSSPDDPVLECAGVGVEIDRLVPPCTTTARTRKKCERYQLSGDAGSRRRRTCPRR